MGRLGAVSDVVLRSIRFPIAEVALALAVLSVVGSGGFLATSLPPSMPRGLVEIWAATSSCGMAAFICIILSMVCGWSFASMVEHGELLTLLSMPVSRWLVLSVAAVGCIAVPAAIVSLCAALAAYLYAPNPSASGIAVAAVTATALPMIVFSTVYASATISKSRWLVVAAGFVTWIALSIAGSVLALFLRLSKPSLATAIAVACINPGTATLLLHGAIKTSPVTVASIASAIDWGIAIAIALATIVIAGRRWEPV